MQEVVAPLVVLPQDRVHVGVEIEPFVGGVLLRRVGLDLRQQGFGWILDVVDRRVDGHLFKDRGTQLHHRHLEHLQRLAQLRRKRHHLTLLLTKTKIWTCHASTILESAHFLQASSVPHFVNARIIVERSRGSKPLLGSLLQVEE